MPEDEKERLNRKLIELLNELRVALPGIQALFAFLLILPFTEGFQKVDAVQESTYFASFLSAALASALLIAPSAYHRIRWRYLDQEELEEKQRMLVTSNRLAVAGLVLLGLAMTGVVFLISDLLFGTVVGAVATAGVAGVFTGTWYVLPLVRRIRDRERAP